MRTWTGVMVGVVAVFAAATMAVAQPPDGVRRGPGPGGQGGPGHPPGPPLDRLLQLTPDQQAAAKALHEQEREAVHPLMEKMRPAHEALRKLLDEDTTDAAAVGDQVLAINAVQKEIKTIHESFQEKFKALLTPEQLAKLKETESRMGQHRGPGPGGPGFMPFFGPPPPPK